ACLTETLQTSSGCPAIVKFISDLVADRRGFKHVLSYRGISRRLRKLPILRSPFAQIIGVFHFLAPLPDLTFASAHTLLYTRAVTRVWSRRDKPRTSLLGRPKPLPARESS